MSRRGSRQRCPRRRCALLRALAAAAVRPSCRRRRTAWRRPATREGSQRPGVRAARRRRARCRRASRGEHSSGCVPPQSHLRDWRGGPSEERWIRTPEPKRGRAEAGRPPLVMCATPAQTDPKSLGRTPCPEGFRASDRLSSVSRETASMGACQRPRWASGSEHGTRTYQYVCIARRHEIARAGSEDASTTSTAADFRPSNEHDSGRTGR
jgi:hypothetical protein